MAKNLPYFKFKVAEWLTGDIVYEPFNVQGVFINICALYWQRNGILMIEDVNKRLRNPPELQALIDKFLTVKDGFISINFLNEQLTEREPKAEQSRKNGKNGGRPKKTENIDKKTNPVFFENQTGFEHKPNIEKKREEKKRNNEFNFSFVEPDFRESFLVWYKYRMEIKPFRIQVEVESSYSELKSLCHISGKDAMKIVRSSIGNGYNSLQLPTSKTPVQTNNLQGTI